MISGIKVRRYKEMIQTISKTSLDDEIIYSWLRNEAILVVNVILVANGTAFYEN